MKIISSIKINSTQILVNGVSREIPVAEENNWTKALYTSLELSYPKFYKMDSLAKMAFISLQMMEKEVALSEMETSDVALIFANSSSSQATDLKFIDSYTEKGSPSPSLFVYTLPNILTGEISIFKKWYGENIFFIDENFNAEFFIDQINFYLSKGSKACLCGWVSALSDTEECFLFYITNEEGTLTENELNTLFKQ
ncbi:MAG: 3-oxoacyl-ACP synthase [Crocinitomicaceae bacterium]